MPRIVKADALHAQYVADRLRYADWLEVFASTGEQPIHAFRAALANPEASVFAAMADDGGPFLLFGVSPLSGCRREVGVPWLLATDEVSRHRLWVRKQGPEILKALSVGFETLLNYAYEGNHLHLRWCRLLGFTLGALPPVRRRGLTFVSITKALF